MLLKFYKKHGFVKGETVFRRLYCSTVNMKQFLPETILRRLLQFATFEARSSTSWRT